MIDSSPSQGPAVSHPSPTFLYLDYWNVMEKRTAPPTRSSMWSILCSSMPPRDQTKPSGSLQWEFATPTGSMQQLRRRVFYGQILTISLTQTVMNVSL